MGNHTLFCLILSFFPLLVWLGVYVREQALLPSICLFAFSSIFQSFFLWWFGTGFVCGGACYASLNCLCLLFSSSNF